MPEGDVVHRAATRLHAALAGEVLLGSDLRWPSLATVDLSGRPVLEVVSVGKHLLMRLGTAREETPDGRLAGQERALTLHSHLRMEGSWHLHRPAEAFVSRPVEGVRAVLTTQPWVAVGHRLGMLDLLPTSREHELVGHLGLDVLGARWNPAEAADRLRADPDRSVGEALLDQRVLAGVGTFYMSEALFLIGTTPWSPVRQVPDLDRLVDLLHRLLSQGATRAVQATTGDLRPGRRNYVHARAGRPCLRCGSTVQVEMIGPAPQDRTSFFCPVCQVGERPAPGSTTTPLQRVRGYPARRVRYTQPGAGGGVRQRRPGRRSPGR